MMKNEMSRRTFLGGSMAAAGALSMAQLRGLAEAAQAGGMAAPAQSGRLDHLRPSGAPDEAFWATVRREYSIVDDMVYMNNGTLGPMPRNVVDAQIRYLLEVASDPRNPLGSRVEGVREKVAAFVGADADEIVLTRSTTEGEKIFAAGLDMNAGDEIVMSTQEHGGGAGAWRMRAQREGIKIVEVEIPNPPESVDQVVGLMEQAFTPRTKVLLVSYPIYVTGLMMPIQALADVAHRHGALITVDAAHALGMLDLDLHALGVDHFTTAGQKWLMAGTGTGVAYFKRDIQERIWADMAGGNREPEGARKYERSGQRHLPSVVAMGDAVDFHNAIGKQHIEARIRFLASRLKTGLSEIPGVRVATSTSADMSGGLTTLAVGDVPSARLRQVVMERAGIFITGSGWNPQAARVSTHVYASPGEVDRLLDAIRYVAENASNLTSTAG